MAISEYDAFGPWIYEITDEHPVPPLFEAFCPPAGSSLLQLKLPREIERRIATPDMDLYDYVLSADEDALTILKRCDKAVDTSLIHYEDIKALRIFRKFLKGTLSIYTVHDTVQVPFNTVSINLILRLVRIMRRRYLPAKSLTGSPDASCSMDSFSGADVLFLNLLRDMATDGEQLVRGAYQCSLPLKYSGNSFKDRMMNRMRKPETQSAVHLVTPDELIIVEREQTDKKRRQSFGYEYMYAPIANITGIGYTPDSDYSGIEKVSVSTGKDRFDFYISPDNSSLKGFYGRLCTSA